VPAVLPAVPLEPAAAPVPVAVELPALPVVPLGLALLSVLLPVAPLVAPVPDPEVPPELPDVWAMAIPPMARPAAAARAVRVFLVVIMRNSLNGNPEGSGWNKQAGRSQLLHRLRFHPSHKKWV
jgi:hypothetical protein